MMSEQEKQYIVKQRALGKSFVQIGRELGRGESSVRYVFHHIMDEAPKAGEVIPTMFLGAGTSGTPRCKYCGREFMRPALGGKQLFCCARCRNAWGNEQKRRTLTAGSANSAGVSLLPSATRRNGSAAGNVLLTAGKLRRPWRCGDDRF